MRKNPQKRGLGLLTSPTLDTPPYTSYKPPGGGNCYDNAVAESFFQLLKRERIKRRVYRTRDEAKADIFDYIEMFYNPKRRHGNNKNLSPVEYEKSYIMKVKSV